MFVYFVWFVVESFNGIGRNARAPYGEELDGKMR
jgi:hypothetical protein